MPLVTDQDYLSPEEGKGRCSATPCCMYQADIWADGTIPEPYRVSYKQIILILICNARAQCPLYFGVKDNFKSRVRRIGKQFVMLPSVFAVCRERCVWVRHSSALFSMAATVCASSTD